MYLTANTIPDKASMCNIYPIIIPKIATLSVKTTVRGIINVKIPPTSNDKAVPTIPKTKKTL